MCGRASTEIVADRDDIAAVPTRMAEIQKAPVKRLSPFDVLIGLRLSIIRRAADMLVLHFGPIRCHPSGTGTVADYALHVQCPWRLDGPSGTVTGRDDLWEYAGPGQRPQNWSPDDGLSLQDQKFANLFVWDESTRSWVNESDGFGVIAAQQASRGDVRLHLANAHEILLFPASCIHEAWRLFAIDGERHVVFPDERQDFAVSRRKKALADQEYEVWLRVIEAPKDASCMEAPPPLVISSDGARYRCGRCGVVLLVAELGALKDFVVRCRRCDRYNEVPF